MDSNTESLQEDKYRDAVSYAKEQIKKELMRKNQINQMFNEGLSSYPVNFKI